MFSSAVLKGIDDLKVKGFRPEQMQVGALLRFPAAPPRRSSRATACLRKEMCWPLWRIASTHSLLAVHRRLLHQGAHSLQDKVLELYERHLAAPTREERLRKDTISHFVLRLAYCRTGETRRAARLLRGVCKVAPRRRGARGMAHGSHWRLRACTPSAPAPASLQLASVCRPNALAQTSIA
jgi:hypothetical protein